MFLAAMASHVLTGLVITMFPPQSKGEAAGVPISQHATCLRVTRHADFSTVDVMVGTPPTQMSALLRLDGIKSREDGDKSLRLFSQYVVESKTVSCTLNGVCRDVLILANGDRQTLHLNQGEFAYTHGGVERQSYTTASLINSVVGEFFLREGYDYWLTSTHLCYSSNTTLPPKASSVNVTLEAGAMIANKYDLFNNDVLRNTPAGSTDSCDEGSVTVFPHLASIETNWLSIADTGLYNTEPDGVKARRYIAEVGVECARNNSELNRDLSLYELDCLPYTSCRTDRNIPFRRVATSSIFISLRDNGHYFLIAEHDYTLENLPRLADSVQSFYGSLLKMAAITLAAAVVFVRSKKRTASSSWLFNNCVSISFKKGPLESLEGEGAENTTEDRIVGFIAIVGRMSVVLIRVGALSHDGQLRVCIAELVSCILSFIHFLLRYEGLLKDDEESPVSKLGGSTSVIDSTAAVMVAFSDPPLLAASTSSFDPIARMLVSLLISIIVVTRCAFSAACCGALWPVFYNVTSRRDYSIVLVYSGVVWCVHNAVLAITMCDLFVAPTAYSMSRSLFGHAAYMSMVRATLFLAFVVAGLPRLMATSRHILSKRSKID